VRNYFGKSAKTAANREWTLADPATGLLFFFQRDKKSRGRLENIRVCLR